MKLPRGFGGITEAEISKPDADTILRVVEKAQAGKIYSAMAECILGGCESIGGIKPEMSIVKQIPLVSAEVLCTEIFKQYAISTKVENLFICPFGHRNLHELTKDEDTRDDIAKLKIRKDPSGNPVPYEIDLKEGNEIKVYGEDGGKVAVLITKLSFRDPTLEDFISIQNDNTQKSPLRALKKVYLNCLVDLDGEISDDSGGDLETLKDRYMYELLAFPDIRDFNRVSHALRTYGYQSEIDITCKECGKEFEDRVDWTGFFVYALRSMSKVAGRK
jgi:hypothetical protein